MLADQMISENTEEQVPRRALPRQQVSGLAKAPAHRQPWNRTVAIVDAALRLWEAKQGHRRYPSPWARRSATPEASSEL